MGYFQPERIVLAKGSRTTLDRDAHARRIVSHFPEAEVVEADGTSHSRIDVSGAGLAARVRRGKRTLVLGELGDAVRFSEERGNACPNYWHFSPYGFCPYDCRYCYLAGTIGVKFCPAVKIFMNLPEMLEQIDRIATRAGRPTAFYVGKLQDGLALDALTGYSRVMIPFFARHRYARLTLLTKCGDATNLLDLEHGGHTFLSWSLNPEPVCREFEENTPPPEARLAAMERCAAAGYPVRAVIMPLIPVPEWGEVYGEFLDDLLTRVPLDRITLGGVCSYATARNLMNVKLSADNIISRNMGGRSADGRRRYRKGLRIEMYAHFVERIRRHRPDLTIALCLEEEDVWHAVGLEANLGRCNCVL